MAKRECFNLFDEMYKARDYTWSDACKKGKILAISGTVATDENHRTMYKGNLLAQMEYIYESVGKVLEKAGASFDDVIKTTDFIIPQAVPEYVNTANIRRKYFMNNYPAATGIVVHSLLSPSWLIEIEFLAVLDD